MKYTISKIKPESVYEDAVITYSAIISNGLNSFLTLLSSAEYDRLDLKENYEYDNIKCRGLVFNVKIDISTKTVISDYGKDLLVEMSAALVQQEGDYFLNSTDENLEVELLELVNPEIIGEQKLKLPSIFKFTAKLVRLEIVEVK